MEGRIQRGELFPLLVLLDTQDSKTEHCFNSVCFTGLDRLSLVLAVGVALRRIINNLCDATLRIDETYNEIYKRAQQRRLLRLDSKSAELKLDRENLKFLEESSETFAKLLGFERLDDLNNLAPNRLAALKMLFAFYRRVRKLKQYQDKKKLKF
jgi:hypothetical protein